MQLLRKTPDPATPSDEAVVRQHLLHVWRYLRMHGASVHEADDLAQEAFVIALQKHAAHLDPAATATFLRRTARFLFLRMRRRSRRAVELADAVDLLWARDAERDGGDGLVMALRSCVGELQERARRAVELYYGLGGDDARGRAEAARELGLSDNGMKTLLQRVRQTLRECLQRRRP